MSSIDDRVVEMQFKNAQFEQGIKTSVDSLDKLKKGLDFKGATKSLDGLDKAAKRFTLGTIGDAANQVAVKFNAMQVVAVAALGSIAAKAAQTGFSLVKSLTVDQISTGLKEYETQLNAIQTIMANTASKGTTLTDVNGALAELNEYADKTIYNFSEMTRNIGTFTAAGVDLSTATNAIKGIANLAAVSGSNSQQASTAMYQLSQAMATGTVKLMDWNSVVNAGMGGEVFQDALKETARVSGVAIDDIVAKSGSFRDSLTEGWLTTGILTDTLAKFTGELSNEQLAAQGYTEQQIKDIQALGVMATDAATKVKTGTQLIDVLKESVGSGWAQTWQIVFGDFEEAKALWTGASDVLTGIIGDASDSRNALLSDWKKYGGRDAGITAVTNAFQALMIALKPIKDAWKEIFPPATGMQLAMITKNIAKFTEKLKMGEPTLAKIKSAAKGFFAVLDIGRMFLSALVGSIKNLLTPAQKGSSAILTMSAKLGDWLVNLRDAIKKGDIFVKFFEKLESYIAKPIKFFKDLGSAIKDIDFSSFDRIKELFKLRWDSLQGFIDNIKIAIDAVKDFASSIIDKLFPATEKVEGKGKGKSNFLSDFFKKMFEGFDSDTMIDLLNTGIFAGLALVISGFIKKLGKSSGGLFSEIKDGLLGGAKDIAQSIKTVFGTMTETLKVMQGQIKATTLLTIAIAIGILAASAIALSMVDPAKLTVALGAITLLLTDLIAALAGFKKVGGATGLMSAAAGLVVLSIAVAILSSALKKLSEIPAEQLAAGLGAITVLLGELVLVSWAMSKNSGATMAGAAALVVMSGAIVVLAGAVKMMASLSWEELGRGLAGLGAVLTMLVVVSKTISGGKTALLNAAVFVALAQTVLIISLALKFLGNMDTGALVQGLAAMGTILAMLVVFSKVAGNNTSLATSAVGMLLIAAAMKILVSVIQDLGALSPEELGRGLAGIGGALLAIAAAMNVMPKDIVLQAAALIGVAYALTMITESLSEFAGMSWEQIAKGLVTLAGALGIIALAMYAMSGALPGAAALLVVAGALAILTPILVTLGSLPMGNIGLALGALAAVFAIFAIAGYAMGPAIPVLLGLGVAIALIGVGVALAGVGLLAMAAGLATLAGVAMLGTKAFEAIGDMLLEVIPKAMEAVGNGIVALATVIGENAPVLIQALLDLITAFLAGVIEIAPTIISTVISLIDMLLTALLENAPRFLDMGLKLITALLEGVAANIEGIVSAVLAIVVGILEGIADQLPDLIEAGKDVVVALIEGVSDNIGDIIAAAGDLIVSFLAAVADYRDDVIAAGFDFVIAFIDGLAADISRITGAATNFIVTLLNGMGDNLDKIGEAATQFVLDFFTEIEENGTTIITGGKDMIISLIEGFGTAALEIATAASDMLATFLEGLADAITKDSERIRQAGKDIAYAIADGMSGGLTSKIKSVTESAKNLASSALSGAKNLLGIKSPSREFAKVGEYAGEGFVLGLKGTESDVEQAFTYLNDLLTDAVNNASSDIENYKADLVDLAAAGKQNTDQYIKATAALAESEEEYAKASAAREALLKDLDAEYSKQKQLAKQYEEITTQLDAANSALEDAKGVRDSFNESIKDNNDNFGGFDAATQSLSEYLDAMREQVDKTASVRAGLEQLSQLGLNDKLYKQLAENGVDALPFIESLLDGGKGAIMAINDINNDLDSVASQLGNDTSSHLYQAGVDSAAGMVAGLQSQETEIRLEMERIADFMVNAIKDKLQIKSPSRVFKSVGGFAGEGIAEGVKGTSALVAKATEDVGQQALDALRAVMADIGNSVFDDLNLDPTITPVIDLSQVKTGASKINGMLNSRQIDLGTSTDAAASTASAVRGASDGYPDDGKGSGTTVNFTQYNTSPKELSTADIYRNTNNQIAKAKGALTNA